MDFSVHCPFWGKIFFLFWVNRKRKVSKRFGKLKSKKEKKNYFDFRHLGKAKEVLGLQYPGRQNWSKGSLTAVSPVGRALNCDVGDLDSSLLSLPIEEKAFKLRSSSWQKSALNCGIF